jgi:hypothetical protein
LIHHVLEVGGHRYEAELFSFLGWMSGSCLGTSLLACHLKSFTDACWWDQVVFLTKVIEFFFQNAMSF